jgi:hypothetical protein
MFAIRKLAPEACDDSVDSFLVSVHPDDSAEVRSLLDGRSTACVFRIVRPDGEVRFVEGRVRVEADPAGRAVQVSGIELDVTERQLALDALEARVQNQQTELQALERMLKAPTTQVAAELYDSKPLWTAQPKLLQESAKDYDKLLEQSIEHRMYKGENAVSPEVRRFASLLTRMYARPHDVVELHTFVVTEKLSGMRREKAKAITEEARLLLIEVLGYMAESYRNGNVIAPRSPRR